MRILIIEDEVKTADYLHQGLTESGYIVDRANDGIDGLHMALQHPYELVILDVNLPASTAGTCSAACANAAARG